MRLRRDVLTRKLTKAFAENGSKAEIPLEVQSSGSVSFNEGFGGLYSKPVKPQSEGEQAGLQIQRENINWLFNAITSDIIQNNEHLGALEDEVTGLINSSPNLLTANITLNVGSGETYTNLEDALNEATRYKSLYTNAPRINIVLKSGYILTKGLLFDNGYYGNISISSEDEEVVYDANATCFVVKNFAIAPIVNTIFKDKRKANRAYLIEGGNGAVNQNKGFKDFYSGVAISCGYYYGYKSIMQGCQNNVLYAQKGTIFADEIDIQHFNRAQGIIKHNIYAGYCGFISANNCNISNSTNLCVNINGGYCKMSGMKADKFQNCSWNMNDPFLNVYGNSVIDAQGSLKSSEISGIQSYSNIAINTLTTNGVILN